LTIDMKWFWAKGIEIYFCKSETEVWKAGENRNFSRCRPLPGMFCYQGSESIIALLLRFCLSKGIVD